MTKYLLSDTFDPNFNLYTPDEAREMIRECFGLDIEPRELADGRLVSADGTTLIGRAVERRP
jgi:hypothetical protein